MPHPVLKRVAAPADDPPEIERVVTDLLDTMAAAPRCVGIAAPQIGEEVRICTVDVTDHPKATSCAGLLVLVNPVVVEARGAAVGPGGCLSIPDFTPAVRRATRVAGEAPHPHRGR